MQELDLLRKELAELERQFIEADTEASAKKTSINGTFGKLGSKWSALYSPDLMIAVTVTGQLSLLMLIESLELAGIPVVSGNTDGIVIKCPQHLENRLAEIVAEWEQCTGFDTEETRYKALFSRDVNNYVAIKTDDGVKTKGVFADPGLMKNPSDVICSKAVANFLRDGTPVAETIVRCRDIRQFLTVQRVTGGAQIPKSHRWLDDWRQVEDRVWVMWYGDKQYKEKRKSRPAPVLVTDDADYLGKVVRYYHSTKSNTHIEYCNNGKKVPSSDNAMPMMTLSDTFPDDVDYAYYIEQANAMLRDVGVL